MDRLRGARSGHHHDRDGFNAEYSGTPPWDIGRPQPALLAVAKEGALRGRVLDAGCGTGEHALLGAGLGFDATGFDFAPAAIERAEAKARARGLTARFLVADACELETVGGPFDTVLDSGLFHSLDDADRVAYVAGLKAVLAPGGRFFLLCFSDQMPEDWGPRRISESEIRKTFRDGWRVDAIDPVTIAATVTPDGFAGWLARISRV